MSLGSIYFAVLSICKIHCLFRTHLQISYLRWMIMNATVTRALYVDANDLNILSYTPSACQRLSLFQAVLYEPYFRGISIHLQPVVRTWMIPFVTRLSSAIGLPTLALGGSKGLMNSHSLSLSSRNSTRHHTQRRLK